MKVIKTKAQRYVGSRSTCNQCGSILEIESEEDIIDYETERGLMFNVTVAIAPCPTCDNNVWFSEKFDNEEVDV